VAGLVVRDGDRALEMVEDAAATATSTELFGLGDAPDDGALVELIDAAELLRALFGLHQRKNCDTHHNSLTYLEL
jgi:hypothetical protein